MKKSMKFILSIIPIFILAIVIPVTTKAEEQVKTISVNETVSDITSSSNPVRYDFTIDKGGCVEVIFEHDTYGNESDCDSYEDYEDEDVYVDDEEIYASKETTCWEIELYDRDDDCLLEFESFSDCETSTVGSVWLEKGNYYILVSSFNSWAHTTEYNMTIDYRQPKRISVNETVSDMNDDEEDVIYYEFTLDKAGYIMIETDKCDMICLQDKNNTIESTLISYDEIRSRKSDYMGLPKGIYFIKVIPKYYEEHEIRINYKESSTWEKEPNDSFKFASQIKVNEMVNGSNQVFDHYYYGDDYYYKEGDENYYDDDYFCVNLPEDGYINIEFSHQISDNSLGLNRNPKYFLILIDENKKEYFLNREKEIRSKIAPNKSKSKNVGLKKGKYLIRVLSNEKFGSTYQFKVNFKKTSNWEKEFNNTISTANSLRVNSKMKGNIACNYKYDYEQKIENEYDIDYYKVIVNKKSKLRVKFNHKVYKNDTSKGWRIKLYDSKGKKIHTMASRVSVKNFTSKELTLLKGTYYISIEPYTILFRSDKDEPYNILYDCDYDLMVTTK